ncbi:hypothetical protein HK405_009248, partial [Cladochytrium tenue]
MLSVRVNDTSAVNVADSIALVATPSGPTANTTTEPAEHAGLAHELTATVLEAPKSSRRRPPFNCASRTHLATILGSVLAEDLPKGHNRPAGRPILHLRCRNPRLPLRIGALAFDGSASTFRITATMSSRAAILWSTCKRLIAAGADPSWSDANVLIHAIYSRQLDLVEFLVSDSRVQRILANNETLLRNLLQDVVQQGADFLEPFLVLKLVTLEDAAILLKEEAVSLPLELLARVLWRLHPHAVAQLRRLSRRAAAAIDILLPAVPFAVSCLTGQPIDLARWRYDELDDIAASTYVDPSDPPPEPVRVVDFRHLPVSFTIALFMREGFSLDAINCVAEDHEWDESSGHLDTALPGNQHVTTAFRHLIFERPDRLCSLGRKSDACLKWAATV